MRLVRACRSIATLLLAAAAAGAGSAPAAAATPAKAAASPRAAATAAYVGTWSIDPSKCKVPQEQQGAPMILKRTGYDQHEAHCAFKSLRRSGSAWWVSAQCLVEGAKQADRFTLRVKGDTLTMARGKDASVYKRCK
jgi:hypothetical protein